MLRLSGLKTSASSPRTLEYFQCKGGKNSQQAEIFRINSEYGPLSQKKSPLKSQSRKLVKIQDGRRDITEI